MKAFSDYFGMKERGTSWGTEVRAGITTFLTMAYILFVNPMILKDAGVPFEACVVGTAIAAGLSSILMGAIANFPIALASGMGLNSVLAYTIILKQGISWQAGMGLIFLDGLIVLLLVLVGLREAVMNAIPASLRHAIAAGIGLFIAFIGVLNSGLAVIDKESLLPKAGDITQPGPLVAALGTLIIAGLVTMRVKGGILLGILINTVLALLLGVAKIPKGIEPPDFSTIGALDISGALKLSLVPLLIGLMIVDFFDTLGTATALGYQAKLLDKEGRILSIGRVLGIDAIAAMIGGVCGASSVTSYIESAAGVSEGGRTGLTSIVVGILFLLGIFLAPFAAIVPKEATAPALIIIGFLMMGSLMEIDFGDLEIAIPAFVTFLAMPVMYSISHGIGYGFITYVIIKAIRGKFRDVHPLMYAVALIFGLSFALLPTK